MKKKKILVIVALVIIVIVGYFTFIHQSLIDNIIEIRFENRPNDEASRGDDSVVGFTYMVVTELGMDVVGGRRDSEVQLPDVLTDTNWSLKKLICEEGGYDLAPHAGEMLTLSSYPISEVYMGTEKLDVHILSDSEKIVCVYKTVRKGSSTTAPGVFPAK